MNTSSQHRAATILGPRMRPDSSEQLRAAVEAAGTADKPLADRDPVRIAVEVKYRSDVFPFPTREAPRRVCILTGQRLTRAALSEMSPMLLRLGIACVQRKLLRRSPPYVT